jgi:hypothetical protein
MSFSNDYDLVNRGYVNAVAGPGGSLNLWSGAKNGNIWNGDAGAGNVGIGTTAPTAKLEVVGRIIGKSLITYQATDDISGGILLYSTDSQGGGMFREAGANGNLVLRNQGINTVNINNGNVGIGTTAPDAKLVIGGIARTTSTSFGNNQDLVTKGYVDSVAVATGFLPLAGGTMTGDLNMGTKNITNANSITVSKLNVNVIDPLYSIDGKKYASFGASFVGGLKEEYTSKLSLKDKNSFGEYEAVIDFDTVLVGSDLWLWRQVVDFSADNIEVVATPYKRFASVYYEIEENKIFFRSDRPADISYRLTGHRFDWKQWPTIPADQSGEGMIVM